MEILGRHWKGLELGKGLIGEGCVADENHVLSAVAGELKPGLDVAIPVLPILALAEGYHDRLAAFEIGRDGRDGGLRRDNLRDLFPVLCRLDQILNRVHIRAATLRDGLRIVDRSEEIEGRSHHICEERGAVVAGLP